MDPYDCPLLGLKWCDVMYVDVGVPFGPKMGAAMGQICTHAIWLINYLYDYIGVALNLAGSHFLALKNLLQCVGLPLNSKKVDDPSHMITCLGIEINAQTGILLMLI